jgi:hypothetical protein
MCVAFLVLTGTRRTGQSVGISNKVKSQDVWFSIGIETLQAMVKLLYEFEHEALLPRKLLCLYRTSCFVGSPEIPRLLGFLEPWILKLQKLHAIT